VADFLLVVVVLLEVLGEGVWMLVVGVLWRRKRWVRKVLVSKTVLGVGDELGRHLMVWKDSQLMS
jgi:hypothetical protein